MDKTTAQDIIDTYLGHGEIELDSRNELIGATYWADETSEWYGVTVADLVDLQEFAIALESDVYSHWCAGCPAQGHETREAARAALPVACECGKATGIACEWSGPIGETVVVQWMPLQHRDAHHEARNPGAFPHNGAIELRVHTECAGMLSADGDDA